MKKLIALLLALVMVLGMIACGAETEEPTTAPTTDGGDTTEAPSTDPAPATGKKAAFVTFGLGGDFFQALADCFVAQFSADGWDAQYADGAFDPTTQIQAAENYIAMGVDVLYIWSVAPDAMGSVIEQAQAKGIKVVAFVAPTEKYDALMVSDDADIADNCAKLAAKWIDETFADAADHSVPVAVLSCRTAETGVIQADELIKIEQFSQKAKFEIEVECADENMTTGQETMENLYVQNPDIKVFLSAHNGLAMGVNNYFTGLSSPVTDYSDMGIFCVNGDTTTAETIKSSIDGQSPFRGTVMTGSVVDTANEMLYVANGLMDGSLQAGHVQKAGTLFVYADTVDEYLTTGAVVSVTAEDFN